MEGEEEKQRGVGIGVDKGEGVVAEVVECMRGGRERNNRRTRKWRGRSRRRRGRGRSGEEVEWCEKGGVGGGGECGGRT